MPPTALAHLDQGTREGGLLLLDHLLDATPGSHQLRVGLTHHCHHGVNQLGEEALLRVESGGGAAEAAAGGKQSARKAISLQHSSAEGVLARPTPRSAIRPCRALLSLSMPQRSHSLAPSMQPGNPRCLPSTPAPGCGLDCAHTPPSPLPHLTAAPSTSRPYRTARRSTRRSTYSRPSLPGRAPSAMAKLSVRMWSATTLQWKECAELGWGVGKTTAGPVAVAPLHPGAGMRS